MIRPICLLLSLGLIIPCLPLTAQNEAPPELNIHRLIEVAFPTQANTLYQVQFCSSELLEDGWVDVGEPILGTGEPLRVGARQEEKVGFFRVRAIDREIGGDGAVLGGILELPDVIPDKGNDDAAADGTPSNPIIAILRESNQSEKNEESEFWIAYLKFRHGKPIGPLLEEGNFDAAAKYEGQGYQVKRVRITIDE